MNSKSTDHVLFTKRAVQKPTRTTAKEAVLRCYSDARCIIQTDIPSCCTFVNLLFIQIRLNFKKSTMLIRSTRQHTIE